jgi:hypothetical protein
VVGENAVVRNQDRRRVRGEEGEGRDVVYTETLSQLFFPSFLLLGEVRKLEEGDGSPHLSRTAMHAWK